MIKKKIIPVIIPPANVIPPILKSSLNGSPVVKDSSIQCHNVSKNDAPR